jgi:hypothetical protein
MTLDRRFARHFFLAALTVVSLYLAGRGRLAPPPLAHPSRVPAWWAAQGSVVAVFSATRLVLLIVGGYWLTLLATVAAVAAVNPGRLVRAVSSRRLIGGRQAVRLALGASALGSALAGGATPVFAAPPQGPGPAPTITNLAGLGHPLAGLPPVQSGSAATGLPPITGTQPAPTPSSPTAGAPTPTNTTTATAPEPAPESPAPPAAASSDIAPPTVASPAAASPAASSSASPAAPAETAPPASSANTAGPTPPANSAPATRPAETVQTDGPEVTAPTAGAGGAANGDRDGTASTWIVRPGDNLWVIAEETLEAAWGGAPSDRQVAGYWINVIAANRSGLPDPSDPSLLFPGDVIILPPIPSP